MRFFTFINAFYSELLKDYQEISQKYTSQIERLKRLEQENTEKDEKIKDLQEKLGSFLAKEQAKDNLIDNGDEKLEKSQKFDNENPVKQESFRLPSRESLKQQNIDLNENGKEKISEKVILLKIKYKN